MAAEDFRSTLSYCCKGCMSAAMPDRTSDRCCLQISLIEMNQLQESEDKGERIRFSSTIPFSFAG